MSQDISQKFQQIDEQLDTIARTVIENRQDIVWIKDHMSTKEDQREIMNTLDILVKLAKKKDEELTFMGERVKRIEHDVEKLKPAAGLV